MELLPRLVYISSPTYGFSHTISSLALPFLDEVKSFLSSLPDITQNTGWHPLAGPLCAQVGSAILFPVTGLLLALAVLFGLTQRELREL